MKKKHVLYSVGVIIRTLNEERYIAKCIDILNSQKKDLIKSSDILVIDSGSSDSTVQIVKSKKCRLIEIQPQEFNFGGTLNLGFNNMPTDLIICLSAHAIPVNDQYLNEMVKHFYQIKNLAAVYSRQIAWPDAVFMEKIRIKEYFPDSYMHFDKVSDKLHFSNVSSCIKKSIWKERNFLLLPASEDAEWAEAIINKDLNIIYNPDAVVYHSHNESPLNKARRHLQFFQTQNYGNNNTLIVIFKSFYFAAAHIKNHIKTTILYKGSISEKIKTILYSFIEALLITGIFLKSLLNKESLK